MVEEEKVKLKKIELKIEYKKGDYITLDSFIEQMGLQDVMETTDDKYFKYRLFAEIIKVLKNFGAVKEAGKEAKKVLSNKKGRGRKSIIYKVIKDITMTWIIEP